MKGNQLILSICKKVAAIITAFLTFFTVASWSQNAFGKYHDLLNAALISISWVLLLTGMIHSKANDRIYKWWLFGQIRFRHLLIYSAIMFCMIIIFPLDSKLFPDICHMIATGLGVLGVFLFVVGWYKMWSKWWWVFVPLLVLSVIVLVTSFMFKEQVPWQVGHGEFLILVTALGFLAKIGK